MVAQCSISALNPVHYHPWPRQLGMRAQQDVIARQIPEDNVNLT